MNLHLEDRHVLIAGGAKGIGYARAVDFLEEGCRVSLVGRDRQRVEQVAAMLDPTSRRVGGFFADLTDEAAARQVLDAADARHAKPAGTSS